MTAGVVMTNDFGSHRDKFGERIIFPIVDVEERVDSRFGGAAHGDNRGPTEVPLEASPAGNPNLCQRVERSSTDCGEQRRRLRAADAAIVVEGYLDVIACHQAGIENVIATLGTALTEDHASILSRHAKRIILAFDADVAGLKAAQKASAIFCSAAKWTCECLPCRMAKISDSMLKAGKEDRAYAGAIEGCPAGHRVLSAHGW